MSGSASRTASKSELTIVRLYHDLLGTYGDAGNTEVLVHRAKARGVAVSVIDINPGEQVPRTAEIYLIGGGEDGPQTAALELLRADGGLTSAAGQGATVFAVCAGFQLIGSSLPASGGELTDGLGLVAAYTRYTSDPRSVGEIVTQMPTQDGSGLILTGFENHQGFTQLGEGVSPLGTVLLGVGNGLPTEDNTVTRPEGVWAGNVFGTYLHGPVLARNPELADIVLSSQLGELAPFDDELAEAFARERRTTLFK